MEVSAFQCDILYKSALTCYFNVGRWPAVHCLVLNMLLHITYIILFTNLFCFRAVKIPSTDLVIASEHVHGHHTDGEGDCANDHLPGVGGHQETMHTEQTGQHGATEFLNNRRTINAHCEEQEVNIHLYIKRMSLKEVQMVWKSMVFKFGQVSNQKESQSQCKSKINHQYSLDRLWGIRYVKPIFSLEYFSVKLFYISFTTPL